MALQGPLSPTEVWPGPRWPPHLHGPSPLRQPLPCPAPLRAQSPSPPPVSVSTQARSFLRGSGTPGPQCSASPPCLPSPVYIAQQAHQTSAYVSKNWGGKSLKFEILKKDIKLLIMGNQDLLEPWILLYLFAVLSCFYFELHGWVVGGASL